MSKSGKHLAEQHLEKLNELKSAYQAAKNDPDPEKVLKSIPTQKIADKLNIPLTLIFQHMQVKPAYIYALLTEKHLECAEKILRHLETTPLKKLDHDIKKMTEHLREAGFADNFDTAFELINTSLKEIKETLVWSYTHRHDTEKNKKRAEGLFSRHFSNFFEPANDKSLKPHF